MEENNIKKSEIENSVVEGSHVERSNIDDSKIINSQVENSVVERSNIEDTKIEGVKIENNQIKKSVSFGGGNNSVGDSDLIKQRLGNVSSFLKNEKVWVIGFIIIALILGAYLRSLPMQDHNPGAPGRQPGLWNIATNDWTLGPDLDPWLFTRIAEIVVNEGSIPEKDMMRNVPLGFENSRETVLLPHLIAWTYHGLNIIYDDVSIEFAAALFPVIMFVLTILSFFLFVREIFVRKSKKSKRKANIIALISTFFMIVMPVFLARTIAGIPEKESASFFFMFLAFYLFLKAWKSEKTKKALLFSLLAGLSTGALSLIWGGVLYVFITIAVATLCAFILNKVHRKEFLVYSTWVVVSLFIFLFFSDKNNLLNIIKSMDAGLVTTTLFILVIHFILWNTNLSKINLIKNSKIPKNLISLIVAILSLLILAIVLLGPGFIFEKIQGLHQTMFKPITGRWSVTVAENKQPYFREWSGNFGPMIQNIPLVFWMFFIGSVVLFKKSLNKIKQKDAWALTGLYILFLSGLIFSRYSTVGLLNGDNFVSKLFYYGAAFLFIGFLIYYYSKYDRRGDKGFEKMDYEFLFLLILFILTLFTARSAVRLIMVLAPVAVIFVGFIIVESIEQFRRTKDETMKMIFGVIMILILLASLFSFYQYYNVTKNQAYYGSIPSSYNQQWQKAMKWVDDETAEDAVFSHWWDYGYWVQSIGKRATVLDGGNAITYWNYLMGRLVLTGDNQDDALEFLYNHDADYLLIDSSDIGKYGAFSSIGSNQDFDRYSWIGTFLVNEAQTQETNNMTIFFYQGGIALDEDITITEDGNEIFIPQQGSYVGGIFIPVSNEDNKTLFAQPYIVLVDNLKRQHRVNLKYLSVSGEFVEFDEGIEACAYLFPSLDVQGGGVNSNEIGAAMYISPRLMRGMLAQVYILEDPLNNFPNFKIAHKEQSLIVDDLRNQGMAVPDFIFYQGIQGPIKIWEIEYTGKEETKEEYLDIDASKYIDWAL
ncbi:hypothetical protein HOD75_04380 [archaeon]|jgi:asparagine N-glycosylation enzyme membrane subunit Stt3|nr:hypothetical protein [archaeon]MBT4242101.1 hypothetical protein [archaeon]MBT4417789.1 hypothetical protein [archaeon]